MWIIYILLVTFSVAVVAGIILVIYASAIIARPWPERMHRATMMSCNEPTEPGPIAPDVAQVMRPCALGTREQIELGEQMTDRFPEVMRCLFGCPGGGSGRASPMIPPIGRGGKPLQLGLSGDGHTRRAVTPWMRSGAERK
jgi:hypothetical protein